MGDRTAIEWAATKNADGTMTAGATWNPVTGCTKVSPACANCYIERQTPMRVAGRKFVRGHIPLEFHENRLDVPLRRRQPTTYFVNSMSDLFHDDVPDAFISRVFGVMGETPRHTFQVLTKRPARMLDYVRRQQESWTSIGCCGPLLNVWLGVSVENQHFAEERIPLLLQTPAAVRFLSCEPLLGPLDVGRWLRQSCCGNATDGDYENGEPPQCCGDPFEPLDWVITGGESGPRVRASYPAWFRFLRDQCVDAGVPFFFKQWGGRTPKSGGRLLDGVEWSQMPAAR